MPIGAGSHVDTQLPTLRTAGPPAQVSAEPRLSDGEGFAELVVELIGSTGLVHKDRLEELRRLSEATSCSQALVDAGFATQESAGRARAARHGVPYVDLVEVRPSPDAVSLVPLHVLKRIVAMPYAVESDVLRVAIADPSNIHAIDELRLATRLQVELAVSPAGDILEEIKRLERSSEAISGRGSQPVGFRKNPGRSTVISILRSAFSSSRGITEAPILGCREIRPPRGVRGESHGHGTSTTSKTRRTTSSAVTFSASASYDRTRRCRRTSGPTAFTSSGVT